MKNHTRFEDLVYDELERSRSKHGPIQSLHEGYAVILEELDEVKAEVWKKAKERDHDALYTELVQTAAMCQRMAEDVLEREGLVQ